MELLGTKQDVERFKSFYNKPIPSVMKNIIVKCLDLYNLRKNIIEILKKIREREDMIKILTSGDKKAIIAIHKISKLIRKKIKDWLNEKSCPFKEFIYKGNNYLQKMDTDLIKLQSALSPNPEDSTALNNKNFKF